MKKPILFLIFFFIFLIVLSEVFLRWFKPVYFCNTVTQFRYDKELGSAAKPNLQKSILTDHIIEIITNDIGSRNYLNKDDLLKYKKIVFCVGDSFTEGVGNLADQSYPFYLDLFLNRNKETGVYEKDFAVLNLGVGGYGSIQAYLSAKIYAGKIGKIPDVIIYFVCPNDESDDAGFKSGYSSRFAISGSPYYNQVQITLNEMLERSQLGARAKLLFGPMVHRKAKSSKPVGIKQFDPRNLTGLRDLINFTKEKNIKLILSDTGYGTGDYELVKEFARENGIAFADYKPDVKSVAAAMPSLPVYNSHSGGHFRPWVNFIIASKFAAISVPWIAGHQT